jgi:hypothetical protein
MLLAFVPVFVPFFVRKTFMDGHAKVPFSLEKDRGDAIIPAAHKTSSGESSNGIQ